MITTGTPLWIAVTANGAAWFAIHIICGYAASRLPIRFFDPGSFLYRERRIEGNGKLYERIFMIKKWKELLPDGGDFFGRGFRKRHLALPSDPAYLDRFIRETCRAELTHLVTFLCAFLFFLWNAPFIAVWMIPYAFFVNIPCVLAQRYNRPRLASMARMADARAMKRSTAAASVLPEYPGTSADSMSSRP
jgi:glycosyl-4,4'-diaponeurosporenoate acyltransferase